MSLLIVLASNNRLGCRWPRVANALAYCSINEVLFLQPMNKNGEKCWFDFLLNWNEPDEKNGRNSSF